VPHVASVSFGKYLMCYDIVGVGKEFHYYNIIISTTITTQRLSYSQVGKAVIALLLANLKKSETSIRLSINATTAYNNNRAIDFHNSLFRHLP